MRSIMRKINNDRLMSVAQLVATTALVLVGVWAIMLFFSDDQWKPLGPFPEQEVRSDETFVWEVAGAANTQTIPSVDVDDLMVSVTGTKCYKQTVNVNGVVAWQVLDPPGRAYETGRGTRVQDPGCSTKTFENEIPADVIGFVNRHGSPVVVAVTGCETPTDTDRGEGATLCWSTEPFALVP